MQPLHPGEMLREDFLIPLGMTARMLAKEIKVPGRRVVAIVKERRGLDADLCLRLARFFRMTPEFWMNLQKDFELETARQDWPRICKEVSLHPQDRKTGGLRVPKAA
jgi:addiction module HigA family antidote